MFRTFRPYSFVSNNKKLTFSCPYLLVYDYCAHLVLQPRTYGANGQHHLCEALLNSK